jgi:hypothetical protein
VALEKTGENINLTLRIFSVFLFPPLDGYTKKTIFFFAYLYFYSMLINSSPEVYSRKLMYRNVGSVKFRNKVNHAI